MVAERIERLRSMANNGRRTLRFGIRFPIIARPTSDEAWRVAQSILDEMIPERHVMPTSAGAARQGPQVLLDTSAAVPLLVADHAHHKATLEALDGRRLGLAGRAAFETYSVLSRVPAPNRRGRREDQGPKRRVSSAGPGVFDWRRCQAMPLTVLRAMPGVSMPSPFQSPTSATSVTRP